MDNHQPSTETGTQTAGTLGILAAAAHTDRMENWPGRFGLIELRKQTHADRDFWQNKEAYRLLTAEVVMPRAIYDGLPKWERRTALAAAVGLTVDTAVVTGRAAALLWGIKVLSDDPTVELMHTDGKQAGAKSTWPPGVRYRWGMLLSDDISEVHGLRVTGIPRTLRDIAAWHGVMEGMVSIDDARKRWEDTTREYLSQKLLSGAQFAGKVRVREAIELSEANSGSPLESKARYLILKSELAGIQTFELQAEISVGPEENYFVDFLINDWVVVELDGKIKLDGTTFGKTDEMLRKERAREVAIQNTGRRFIRAGWEHLEVGPDGRVPLLMLIDDALRTHPVPVLG